MTERPAIEVVRRGGFLVPASPIDSEALEAFPQGKRLKARITQPRNVQHHRLYWAAIQLVRDNMDDPPPLETLHDAVKVKLGYTRTMTFKDGTQAIIPASIAFDKMDQGEFRAYFDAFARLVNEVLIPGLGSADLEREARLMLGQ